MSVNQCQDPTPEQEALYERDCEIAGLKEQIVEAWRLITESACQDIGNDLYTMLAMWLDQNEQIAKECAK